MPDIEAALEAAERLGGTRVIGPVRHRAPPRGRAFRDPEGNLIGLASQA